MAPGAEELLIVLGEPGTIAGRVLRSDGKPAVKLTVRAEPEAQRKSGLSELHRFWARTDERGSYRLSDLPIGAVGPYPVGSACAFEVRAFFPLKGATLEDPVTGSLNASPATWLPGTGRARAPYVVSQGTAIGRAGRVHISTDANGTIWVGGGTVTCISGQVEI